ncbi:MAG: complex I subunit 5 family protein [Halanaerobium sp.]
MAVIWQQFLSSFQFDSYFPLLAEVGVILTLMTALAAWNYIKENKLWYYVLTLVYLLSTLVVILTNDWFFFLFAWEMVTLATTFMLAWSDWKLVRQYFVIQFSGSSILLFGALAANAFGYAKIGVINSVPLQFLLIMGIGMKSGLFLFHFWLPPIHSEAPAPVSAVLSGWVVKLGYIFLLKIIPMETGNTFLFLIGLAMIVYAGWQALRSADLKIMLAYSTVSQLGFIALAIGTGGQYAFYGAVLHIIAHGFAKTTLFISSGIWQKEYGSRIIYDFKDAISRRPITSAATILSFASLGAVVFTAGYNSKYLIKSAQTAGLLSTVVFFLLGFLSFLYAGRVLYWVFIKDQDYSSFFADLKQGFNHYQIYSQDILALLTGMLGIIVVGFWPEMPGDILAALLEKDFHLLSGFRDTVIYLAFSAYLFYNNNGFKVEPRGNLSLENYLQLFLNFIYGLSRRSVKFDTEKIFETFFYNAIFNASKKLHDFVYQDFTMQLLWIPVFLTVLLLWQQIYSYF